MLFIRPSRLGTATVLIAIATCCAPSLPEETADLVLLGGHIVTMSEAQPEAQAVAIKGDRILAVGSIEDIEPHVDAATETIELDGLTVVPGMIDTHAHLVPLGKRLLQLDARGKSKEEIVSLVYLSI